MKEKCTVASFEKKPLPDTTSVFFNSKPTTGLTQKNQAIVKPKEQQENKLDEQSYSALTVSRKGIGVYHPPQNKENSRNQRSSSEPIVIRSSTNDSVQSSYSAPSLQHPAQSQQKFSSSAVTANLAPQDKKAIEQSFQDDLLMSGQLTPTAGLSPVHLLAIIKDQHNQTSSLSSEERSETKQSQPISIKPGLWR